MSSDSVMMKRKLAAYKALGAPKKCGSSYEKLNNIQVAQLTATYTVTGVIHVPGSGAGYTTGEVVMLLDNGTPSAQVILTADGAGEITGAVLVNTPIYTTVPSTTAEYASVTITGTDGLTIIGVGAKFTLVGPKSFSCYSCLST